MSPPRQYRICFKHRLIIIPTYIVFVKCFFVRIETIIGMVFRVVAHILIRDLFKYANIVVGLSLYIASARAWWNWFFIF